MVAISAKAKASPRREDNTQPTAIRPAAPPKIMTANNAVKVGSIREKRVLFAKLVLDMEKTATDRMGMTANNPTTSAKSGKTKPGTDVRMEQMMNMITQVVVVKSEKARHLLR
jgi:hypothetical protein